MNKFKSFIVKYKRKITAILVVVFIIIISFFFFNNVEKSFERIRCEATLCTDSLCLIWNDSLKRCGTAGALFYETQRRENERLYRVNDSLHKLLLTTIAKEDSLIDQYVSYTNKIEEQIKAVDIYTYRLRKIEMLDSLFFRLKSEEFLNLERIRNERIRQQKQFKLIFQLF